MTFTITEQLFPASRVPPLRETEPPPDAAVTVPPQFVVAAGDDVLTRLVG